MPILTPDLSGRSPLPPPLPTSPLLLVVSLPSPPPLSPSPSPLPFPLPFPLRKFDSILSSLFDFGMLLALRILRPHSLTLTLTLTLTVSHSHCLSLSLSHLSHLSLISLSHLSLISPSSLSHLSLISLSSPLPLSLSPLCLSCFRLSSLFSRMTASKKSAVFFPTSLPSTFPFWSASFRPPWPQVPFFKLRRSRVTSPWKALNLCFLLSMLYFSTLLALLSGNECFPALCGVALRVSKVIQTCWREKQVYQLFP